MNQNSLKFIFLCFIFSSVINITVSVFARINSRHKDFNLLIAYWIYFFFIFVYSFLFHETLLQIATSYFLQFIAINLLVQIVGQKTKWYQPLIYQVPALILSGLLLVKTELGFALSLVPAAVVLALPFLQEAYRTLIKYKEKSNWAEKAMSILFIFFALHNIDFLFLRLDPEAQLWGYSFSLVMIQCISLFVPMAINLRREELFRELKETNLILAEEMLINEILIRTITHDLSSPLTNIANYTDLINSGKIEKKEENQILDRIYFNAQSALKKITNTKSALKTRAMAADIYVEDVLLHNALKIVRQNFDSHLKNKELTFSISCPVEIVVSASEQALIEHVLSHVLSNAIKYSTRGQEIKMTTDIQADGSLILECRDFGVGLPTSAYEKRILSSLPGTEGETGNGFGIMIMGYFMRRFGGTVALELPTDGPGTRVLLKFRQKISTVGATRDPVMTVLNT